MTDAERTSQMVEATAVGLHACGSILRWAELRRTAGRIEVAFLERELLKGHSVQADASVRSTGMTPTAQRLSRPSRSAGNAASALTADSAYCVASMPPPDVMSRHWMLPPTDDVRLKRMVAHRLEADLPVPIDQLVWAYRRGTPASFGEKGVPVLAQAARNDRVGRHMALLSAAGFPVVDVLTTEAEALAALCRYGLKSVDWGGTEVLVLAGRSEWLLAVLTGGVVRFVRRVYVDPAHIEMACQQCRQCLDADASLQNVRRILWCGSPEVSEGQHVLAEKTGLAVQTAVLTEDLCQTGGGPIDAGPLAEFGPTLGLALAGLFERDNVIRFAGYQREEVSPHQHRYERLLAWPRRWAASACALLILAACVHVTAMTWETRKMDRLLAGHNQAASAMASLEPKIRAMQRLQKYRIDVEGIMAAVCAPIPNSIVMSSVQLSRERGLVMTGTAGEPKAIFELVEALRKSDRFAKVQPGRTEPGQGGRFTITAEWVGVNRFSSSSIRGKR